MKKLLPTKKDIVVFIIGFLPAIIAVSYSNPFFGGFAYIFSAFCYPIVILLVGILTSNYTSTLFCAGTTFIAWLATYFLINLFFDGFDKSLFGLEYIFNRALDYALMTLVVLAGRGLVSLIIYFVLRNHRKKHPERTEEQNAKAASTVLNITLITLCAADIAGFFVSFLLFRGMNSEESILSLMIAAASLFFALILEFLTSLLPKSFRFAVTLTIIFNAVFLLVFGAALLIYELIPVRLDMGGVGTSLAIIAFPSFHITAAVISLILRKHYSKSQ